MGTEESQQLPEVPAAVLTADGISALVRSLGEALGFVVLCTPAQSSPPSMPVASAQSIFFVISKVQRKKFAVRVTATTFL